jgi:hypothetical protein
MPVRGKPVFFDEAAFFGRAIFLREAVFFGKVVCFGEAVFRCVALRAVR